MCKKGQKRKKGKNKRRGEKWERENKQKTGIRMRVKRRNES